MSDQYAFAIGFDAEQSHEEEGTAPDNDWTTLYQQVALGIAEAGLPAIDSDRWDEFGLGRIFWGTKAECDAVYQVLVRFDLYIQEERNLDTGYYATPEHKYYVDELGNIFLLPQYLETEGAATVQSISAIPIDAFRLKSVDPIIDAKIQSALSGLVDPAQKTDAPMNAVPAQETSHHDPMAALTAEVERLRAAAETRVAPEVYADLQTYADRQAVHIAELEQVVQTLTTQVEQLQSLMASKIDPQDHIALQTTVSQKNEQIEALQMQLEQAHATVAASIPLSEANLTLQQQIARQNERIVELEQQTAQLQHQVAQAIEPSAHTALKQQFDAQMVQLQDTKILVSQLEQQLQQVSESAMQKVDVARYEAMEQEMTDKAELANEYRRTIQQLEREVQEWQTVAESKVDWAEYQALQNELQHLQARYKRGIVPRLFGWLR